MTDTLRERVAQAMKLAADDPSPVRYWYAEADAAIAIIRNETLEEAARECDTRVNLLHGQFVVLDITRECDAYRIAATAIRALKSKGDNNG